MKTKSKKKKKSRKEILADLIARDASFVEMCKALPPIRKVPKGDLVKLYYERKGREHAR